MGTTQTTNKYRCLRNCMVCKEDFIGVRRVCEPCRYRGGKGLPVLVKRFRAAALAGQTGRIHAEMAAIRVAGMDPAIATIAEIQAAGIIF